MANGRVEMAVTETTIQNSPDFSSTQHGCAHRR